MPHEPHKPHTTTHGGALVPAQRGVSRPPIPFASLADIKDRQALVDELRDRTYALALPATARKPPARKLMQAIKKLKNLKGAA